jgi:hypothetical protein
MGLRELKPNGWIASLGLKALLAKMVSLMVTLMAVKQIAFTAVSVHLWAEVRVVSNGCANTIKE